VPKKPSSRQPKQPVPKPYPMRRPEAPYVPPPPPEPEPDEKGGPRRYRIPQPEVLVASDSFGDSVSVAEARGNLADIVDAVERGQRVQITRRGKPVAVMISIDELRRLASPKVSFASAYSVWRLHFDPDELDVEPSHFDALRDRSPGRDVKLG